jgi:hypothetical protein
MAIFVNNGSKRVQGVSFRREMLSPGGEVVVDRKCCDGVRLRRDDPNLAHYSWLKSFLTYPVPSTQPMST